MLAPDLDLDRAEALADVSRHFLAEHLRRLAGEVVATAGVSRHRVGARRAEIFVERQLGGARVAVPEGDVERADGAHRGPEPADQQRLLVHLLPQALDAMRVLAVQLGREQPVHRAADELAAGVAEIAEADAFDAVIALDLDQRVMPLGDRAAREGGRRLQRHGDGAGANLGDAGHDGSSLAAMSIPPDPKAAAAAP